MVEFVLDAIEGIRAGGADKQTPSNNEHPPGPYMSFLFGAGFSVSAGLPGTRHFVHALERFKAARDQGSGEPVISWRKVLEQAEEDIKQPSGEPAHRVTARYLELMNEVCAQSAARHAFTTEAIQYATSKKLQMSEESIYLAAILIAGTRGDMKRYDESTRPPPIRQKWLPQNFARHAFTTNFDELMPTTFYLGNRPVDVIDGPGLRRLKLNANYPTVAYLHGRHLHYDVRTTGTDIKRKREQPVDEMNELMEQFRDMLRNTGLIVCGYSGAEDLVVEAISRALDDPDSLPFDLWWAPYPDENELHGDVLRLIEKHDRAHLLVRPPENDDSCDAEKPKYYDANALMWDLMMELGLSPTEYTDIWEKASKEATERMGSFGKSARSRWGDEHGTGGRLTRLAGQKPSQEEAKPDATGLAETEAEKQDDKERSYRTEKELRKARVLMNSAWRAAVEGDKETADDLFSMARRSLEELEAEDEVADYAAEMLQAYKVNGNYHKAAEYASIAVNLYEEQNRVQGLASAKLNLGWYRLLIGEYDSSITSSQAGFDQMKVHDSSDAYMPYFNISHAKWLRGDNDALDHYKAGVAEFSGIAFAVKNDFQLFIKLKLTTWEKVDELFAELGLEPPPREEE